MVAPRTREEALTVAAGDTSEWVGLSNLVSVILGGWRRG
jgi:hypothetical protein